PFVLAVGCRYLNDGRKQRGWQAFFLPTVETQGKTVSVEDKLLTIPGKKQEGKDEGGKKGEMS
ncbi:hypothetical protein P9743_12985, partial [Anoxybacillus geothermalis]|nr:hypothetical protein [Anoxybacillus geothermalis]